jgi:hypothetical protein
LKEQRLDSENILGLSQYLTLPKILNLDNDEQLINPIAFHELKLVQLDLIALAYFSKTPDDNR